MKRLLVFVVACAPPPPPQAPPLAAVRSTDLPALYASLFEVGRHWTQPARAELRWNDGSGVERATSNGTVTCWVDSARAVRGGRVARIACHTAVRDRSVLELDATGEPTDSPAGLYVGTATGLWQVEPSFGGEFTNDIAALVPEQRLLAAQPTPGKLRDAEGVHEVVVERADSAWCFLRAYDLDACPGGWSLCLREGDGIVGGSMFQWGVDTRLVVFGDGIAEPQP
jgi:hypothetical protein